MTRAFAGARERAQTVEEPLHSSDLARDDPAEVVDEPIVAAPARQELGKGLDRDERVFDLVRDPGREHLEIREPFGAARLNGVIWPAASPATTPLSIVATMLLRCSLASTTCA